LNERSYGFNAFAFVGEIDLNRLASRLASSILSFKFTSIAHIMVLDKPDIPWDDSEADRLYLAMAHLFELNQLYCGRPDRRSEWNINISLRRSTLNWMN